MRDLQPMNTAFLLELTEDDPTELMDRSLTRDDSTEVVRLDLSPRRTLTSPTGRQESISERALRYAEEGYLEAARRRFGLTERGWFERKTDAHLPIPWYRVRPVVLVQPIAMATMAAMLLTAWGMAMVQQSNLQERIAMQAQDVERTVAAVYAE